MKPGDRIEWTFEEEGEFVGDHEELWSNLMRAWVPIGSSLVHILVSIDDEQITWMNEEGTFYARRNDVDVDDMTKSSVVVVPYTRG